MAKLTRSAQKLFGSTAGTNQMAEFGSFAAGVPARYNGATITPAIIQTLANYLQGWYGAIDGENAPTIEDMNALCYLFSYQLAYGFQAGVPEWNSATTYYIGSIAQDGLGNLYVSLIDNNLNQALSDLTKWKPAVFARTVVAVATTTAIALINANNVFELNSSAGSFNLTLPAPSIFAGQSIVLKDVAGALTNNPVTLVRNAAEKIENLAANYALQANYGSWALFSDGTNWIFLN